MAAVPAAVASFNRCLAAAGNVLILDGGLATELERHGEDLQHDLWSAVGLERFPDKIKRVHGDYFEAGADVATTSSYQATSDGFVRALGCTPAAADGLLARSVALAQEARDEFWAAEGGGSEEGAGVSGGGRVRPLVAASVGPYGAYLADGREYRGGYGKTAGELAAFHLPRLRTLVSQRPDILALETIPCKVEAEALLSLLDEHGGGIPAWMSFSCQDGERTCGGDRLAECAAMCDAHPSVVAVGVNCTAPRHVASLLREARGATSKPLVAYPNKGERWDEGARQWDEGTAAGDGDMAAMAGGWRAAAGAAGLLLGGCCRTTPDTIAALRAATRDAPPP